MARLRIFISSTCYDLDILRSELRPFISSMGYEPVMSEYSDVLYDPRTHTHDSCLKEVPSCDMVILIIGSRFGGTIVPSALSNLDFNVLEQSSTKSGIIELRDKLSVTQIEVMKAVEESIPLYAFVDDRVLHDRNVYEKNKDKKSIIDQIEFPSIQKRETAKYIFEFINFLSHRLTNNTITGFTRLDEIRSHLSCQWSQLFQRLLLEGRTKTQEARRYRDFSERIEDLKAVVLASLTSPDLRDTAKGAIQFRHLISFVSCLLFIDHRSLLLSNCSWDELLVEAKIKEIKTSEDENVHRVRNELLLVLDDFTFYRCRIPRRAFEDFRNDWGNFQKLESHAREAIVDALLEDKEYRRFPMLRYINKQISEVFVEQPATELIELEEQSEQDSNCIEGIAFRCTSNSLEHS